MRILLQASGKKVGSLDGRMSWLGPVRVHLLFSALIWRNKLLIYDFVGLLRATNVLKHYRGFDIPQDSKVKAWLDRVLEHPAFKATCSTDELYLDSYERSVSLFSLFHLTG